MDATAALATYVSSVEFEEIPEEAIDHAKTSIRDYVGLALYGSQHELGEQVIAYLELFPSGGEATVIGDGPAAAPHAAFANGVTGHAVDYDDTFESIVIHPSCTTFPAALAAAEQGGASGRDLLTGYIVGHDVLFRIGQSVAPSHWHHGWHSTATIGVFGAAAAAGSVLGLSERELRMAFGIAGSASAGLKKNSGSMTNPLHCGRAAQLGLSAALLAENGATANPSILEGRYGYGKIMTPDGNYTPEKITEPTVEWAVLDNGFKPYPSGVVTHAPMEALRTIVVREDLQPEDVHSVVVTVDERVTDTIDESNPQTALEAMTSYEFCLAAILRERDAGINEFTDSYVQSDRTREVMKKISVTPVSTLFETDAGAEASYGARVAVTTTDGETITDEIERAPGSPSNPLSEQRLQAKFLECAQTVLSSDRIDELQTAIAELDERDVTAVSALMGTKR